MHWNDLHISTKPIGTQWRDERRRSKLWQGLQKVSSLTKGIVNFTEVSSKVLCHLTQVRCIMRIHQPLELESRFLPIRSIGIPNRFFEWSTTFLCFPLCSTDPADSLSRGDPKPGKLLFFLVSNTSFSKDTRSSRSRSLAASSVDDFSSLAVGGDCKLAVPNSSEAKSMENTFPEPHSITITARMKCALANLQSSILWEVSAPNFRVLPAAYPKLSPDASELLSVFL